jgi:DNA-binding MarR family transcriptional regulator
MAKKLNARSISRLDLKPSALLALLFLSASIPNTPRSRKGTFSTGKRPCVPDAGYRATEVAAFLGCHPSNVTRASRKNERR